MERERERERKRKRKRKRGGEKRPLLNTVSANTSSVVILSLGNDGRMDYKTAASA